MTLEQQLERAKSDARHWENRWRTTNDELYKQCNYTLRLRTRIFELTGQWVDSNLEPIDEAAVQRQIAAMGPLD